MRNQEIRPELARKLNKLRKRDNQAYETVLKKIREIQNSYDVEHYKNLKHGMKSEKRVHIGHFVLTFEYDKEHDKVIFSDYDHHDKIYAKKP